MPHFPADVRKADVIRAFERLGFTVIREREHIALVRLNPDGSRTPLTLPNHARIKGPTLRAACSQSGIQRDQFLAALDE